MLGDRFILVSELFITQEMLGDRLILMSKYCSVLIVYYRKFISGQSECISAVIGHECK